MSENERTKELKVQLWGWILFVICGALFTIAGVRAEDIVTIAASIIFLIACVVFMVPLVKGIMRGNQDD